MGLVRNAKPREPMNLRWRSSLDTGESGPVGWKSLLRFWQRQGQGQGLLTLADLPRDGFEQTTPKSTTPSPLQTMDY